MAMWGLYGLPWKDAIRICIPKKEMIEWFNSIDTIYVWDENKEIGPINTFEKTLADIVYIYGTKDNSSFTLTQAFNNVTKKNTGSFRKLDEQKEMTGYIKNYAWRYENEVRLKIKLNQSVNTEKICIHLPQSIIDSIKITTGPCFVWKNSELYERFMNENRISESGFKNLVNYRDLCSLCEHESFSRKK